MELTPATTEEKAPAKLGHVGSYLFLGAVAVASWFVLPLAAAFVQAAPVVATVLGVGSAAAVTANKPWRDKAVSFFKTAGHWFKESLGQVVSDYKHARDWAKGKAAEAKAAALPPPANDDVEPASTLGAKTSAADFTAVSAPEAKLKTPAPAPAMAHIQRLGMGS